MPDIQPDSIPIDTSEAETTKRETPEAKDPGAWQQEIRGLVLGLKTTQDEGFDLIRKENAEGHRTMAVNVEMIGVGVKKLSERVGDLEAWRGRNNSERVRSIASEVAQTTAQTIAKQPSSADLNNEAAIAKEATKLFTLETRVGVVEGLARDINAKQDSQSTALATLVTWGKQPLVKQLAAAIGGALIVLLGLLTSNLQARYGHPSQPYQPPPIQPQVPR